jgi:hypothetical protein
MRKLMCVLIVFGLLTAALPSAAQETETPTPTSSPTVEGTVEVTGEPTVEVTEATEEPTAEVTEGTAEATAEATGTVTAAATTGTGTTSAAPTTTLTATTAAVSNPPVPSPITVSDQISLDGTVKVASVTADAAGFLGVFATNSAGADAHLIGFTPVQAGTTQNVIIPIDGGMATPFLTVELHKDDGQNGVFEFGKVQGADAPVMLSDGRPASATFKMAGIFAFDQQPVNNTVTIASVVSEIGGWLVIHAAQNNQPGPVLGETLLKPGTNAAVQVTLNTSGQTPVVWAELHADDTTIGTFDFGTIANADLPVFLGTVTATRPINLTNAPTLMLADGTPLTNPSTTAPSITAAGQTPNAANTPNSGTLMIQSVVSPVAGFVDVHTDEDGHPSASLGSAPVQAGTNSNITVQLTAPPGMTIMPVIWPMLHADTNNNGTYDFLMIPGADLPIVYNGAVVTVPVASGVAVPTVIPPAPTAASSATSASTLVPTLVAGATSTEATAEATEGTAEPTAEVTEATEEPTAEVTEGTAEATSETTDTVTPTVTATATP